MIKWYHNSPPTIDNYTNGHKFWGNCFQTGDNRKHKADPWAETHKVSPPDLAPLPGDSFSNYCRELESKQGRENPLGSGGGGQTLKQLKWLETIGQSKKKEGAMQTGSLRVGPPQIYGWMVVWWLILSQLDCTMGCLDVLLNIIFQCVYGSVSGWDEHWTGRLSKEIAPSTVGGPRPIHRRSE